jgi:hypothetical protein
MSALTTVGIECAAGRAIRLWRAAQYARAVAVLRNAGAEPAPIVRVLTRLARATPELPAAVVAAVIETEES